MATTTRLMVIFTLAFTWGACAFANAWDGILSTVQKQNNTTKDPYSLSQEEKEGKDRRRFAEKAENDSNVGAGLAIAAGTALTATGARLVATGMPVPVAIGIDLLAKGAMEFAQAAANRFVGRRNGAQKDILKRDDVYNRPDLQKTDNSDIVQKLNTPELQKLLGDRGVDANEFMNKLANGGFKSAEEIKTALNDKTEISDEDKAKAMELAQLETQKILSEEMGRVAYDREVARTEANSDDGGTGNSLVRSGSMAALSVSDAKFSPASNMANGVEAIASRNKNFSESEEGMQTQAPSKAGTNALDFSLGSWLKGAEAGEINGMPMGEVLQILGIRKPIARENIFQTAHRYFRSYNKWRKSVTLAGL